MADRADKSAFPDGCRSLPPLLFPSPATVLFLIPSARSDIAKESFALSRLGRERGRPDAVECTSHLATSDEWRIGPGPSAWFRRAGIAARCLFQTFGRASSARVDAGSPVASRGWCLAAPSARCLKDVDKMLNAFWTGAATRASGWTGGSSHGLRLAPLAPGTRSCLRQAALGRRRSRMAPSHGGPRTPCRNGSAGTFSRFDR